MRKRLVRVIRSGRFYGAALLYAALFGMLSYSMLLSPAYALIQLNQPQYARVIQQAEMLLLQAAERATVADAVAAATLVPSPVSLTVKVVASALALGVGAAVLYKAYYSAADLLALKTRATPAPGYVGAGLTAPMPSSQVQTGTGGPYPFADTDVSQNGGFCQNKGTYFYGSSGDDQVVYVLPGGQAPSGSGWRAIQNEYKCDPVTYAATAIQFYAHASGNTASALTFQNASAPTAQQVSSTLQSLSDSDSLSLTTKYAQSATAPSGDSTTVIPQPVPEDKTVVKKTSDVAPTDTVIAQPVPAPSNTTITNNTTNNTTTTTTTVNNADGSKTETKSETSTAACTSNAADPRTLGTVLATHQALWKASGLLGTITNLQNLVWPTTIPVYTVHSVVMNRNFTIDFNSYQWFFTAFRSLVISLAGLAAIAIVFM